MQEIFRTGNIVEIALIKSLLEGAGIRFFVFGEHLNGIFGGMAGGFTECQIMVFEQDYDDACDLLEDVGLFDDENSENA